MKLQQMSLKTSRWKFLLTKVSISLMNRDENIMRFLLLSQSFQCIKLHLHEGMYYNWKDTMTNQQVRTFYGIQICFCWCRYKKFWNWERFSQSCNPIFLCKNINKRFQLTLFQNLLENRKLLNTSKIVYHFTTKNNSADDFEHKLA